jgi:hypothetical protein
MRKWGKFFRLKGGGGGVKRKWKILEVISRATRLLFERFLPRNILLFCESIFQLPVNWLFTTADTFPTNCASKRLSCEAVRTSKIRTKVAAPSQAVRLPHSKAATDQAGRPRKGDHDKVAAVEAVGRLAGVIHCQEIGRPSGGKNEQKTYEF